MNADPLKILLVEDNPADARLIHEVLKEKSTRGFSLECVPAMEHALQALIDKVFDVVLLDLSLPDSQGMQTVATMMENKTSVPVIVLTGLFDEEMALKALGQGVNDYFVKAPLDGKLLWRSIRRAARMRESWA